MAHLSSPRINGSAQHPGDSDNGFLVILAYFDEEAAAADFGVFV